MTLNPFVIDGYITNEESKDLECGELYPAETSSDIYRDLCSQARGTFNLEFLRELVTTNRVFFTDKSTGEIYSVTNLAFCRVDNLPRIVFSLGDEREYLSKSISLKHVDYSAVCKFGESTLKRILEKTSSKNPITLIKSSFPFDFSDEFVKSLRFLVNNGSLCVLHQMSLESFDMIEEVIPFGENGILFYYS